MISNGSAQVHLIDFRFTLVYGNAIRVHSNAFKPYFLDYWGCGAIAKRSSSTAKCAMCLRLGGRLALWHSYPNIQLTNFSWIDEYGGFLRSGHIYKRMLLVSAHAGQKSQDTQMIIIITEGWILIVSIYYRIASNLTDNSNYPDTISNYFYLYTGQSMKFEFLLL